MNIGVGGVGGRLLMKPSNRKKSKRTDRPTLPELDQTKRSVLNSLASLQSRRSYQHGMDEFIDWYCSEPRLALNRGVVLRYSWGGTIITEAGNESNVRGLVRIAAA